MKHLTLEAKATTTDLGEFTAIAAAYSVDRANERILPGAFADTIANWQASGKSIPLHWDHSRDAKDIIGTVNPALMKETDQGLMVSGKLDLESEVAKEAWRAMKSNALGLSFGYLVTDEATAEDGVLELKALDVFEITVTPVPANGDTRFLSLKAERDLGDQLKALTERVKALEEVPAEVKDVPEEERKPTPKASDPEADQFDLEWLDAAL